jgi:para-nitrobenzyl esterase
MHRSFYRAKFFSWFDGKGDEIKELGMKRYAGFLIVCTLAVVLGITMLQGATSPEQVKTVNGVIEGATLPSGIRVFRGIPFAAPPVGDLRWKAPQPVKSWTGVRSATQFGQNCMQRPIYGNMGFRGPGMGEDCLYLNVWTGAKSASEKLPVLVYFFGGGLMAGDGSEPRYDGESMAQKGIVSVTISYRLTVFGFLAHPELTEEAPYHASGNYGFLDQNAALKWVQANIAAFGGDPRRVTIAGQSAGSRSTSIQLLSPLSKNLIAGAIMESGSVVSATDPPTLAEAEKKGLQFMAAAGASSLKELRAIPADKLLELTAQREDSRFGPVADNYLLPTGSLVDYIAAGKAAHVPVLEGANSQEQSYLTVLGDNPVTPEGFAATVKKLYGPDADRVLAAYPSVQTKDQVMDTAMMMGSENPMGYNMWLFGESFRKGSGKPVYRYLYSRPRKRFLGASNQLPGQAGGVVTDAAAAAKRPPDRGAAHSAEIEYALGNLSTNSRFAWEPADYKLSQLMEEYFANFIKTGDPNGSTVPKWPAYTPGNEFQIMHFDVESSAGPDAGRPRYIMFDQINHKK